MSITIKIDTDNAAFEDSPGYEVARILRQLADKINQFDGLAGYIKLYDVNGNKVGAFEVEG